MSFIYTPPLTPYLEILHQDDHILVLNKPAGLLSVPGRAPETKDSLATRAQEKFPQARVIHRLDMDTSGLILMALSAEAQKHISRQFETKVTEKSYQALIAGRTKQATGEIDRPMRCHWPKRPLQIIDFAYGKRAITKWRLIQYEGENSRVELTPITGRSHQLRLHCQSLGHPILGDRFYAPQRIIDQSERLCLHAHKIGFTHPAHEEWVTFEAPLPF